MELRETIARKINGTAFNDAAHAKIDAYILHRREEALELADRILAILREGGHLNETANAADDQTRR